MELYNGTLFFRRWRFYVANPHNFNIWTSICYRARILTNDVSCRLSNFFDTISKSISDDGAEAAAKVCSETEGPLLLYSMQD